MNSKQFQEFRCGLVLIVEKIGKEFSYLGKFRLQTRGCQAFYITYKKYWYSKKSGDTEIEILEERIGYRPSPAPYAREVTKFIEQFAEKHNIVVGSLWG